MSLDKSFPRISVNTSRSSSNEDDEDFQRQQVIERAWTTNTRLQKDELLKSQRRSDAIFDKVSNVVTKSQSAYDSVNTFYTANQSILAAAAATIANLNGDSKFIEATMSVFTEYCPIVIRGLESLSQLHTFIGIATKAFSLVITVDLAKRNNNKKVIALKMQMQDTMMILFDLRNMKDPDVKDPEETSIEHRMSALLKKIAEDITEVGSACDHHIKKSFVVSTPLSASTTPTPTPNSAFYLPFIEKRGGPRACLQDDQLMLELINISGESISSITSRRTGDDAKDDLEAAKKKLTQDYNEDGFAAKSDTIREENGNAAKTDAGPTTGLLIRLTTVSKDMQTLWKESEWKGSVKARYFVLALQEYYAEKLTDPSGLLSQDTSVSPLTSSQPLLTLASAVGEHWTVTTLLKDDRWALKYIDVCRVQPILEAIDDDGTGWHADMIQYKRRIHAVIREMYLVIDYDTRGELRYDKRNLPVNRYNINDYLFEPLESENGNDAKLTQITDAHSAMEEERLQENLERIAYDIDSPTTVALVTGPGRIERFILPLVYLLLKRHLKAFYLARTHVLHEEEFWDFSFNYHTAIAIGIQARICFRPWDEDGKGAMVGSEGDPEDLITQKPLSILKYGVRDTLESEIYQHSIATFDSHDNCPQTPRHMLSGYWAGHLWYQDLAKSDSVEGLMQISVTYILGECRIRFSSCSDVSAKRDPFSHLPYHAMLKVDSVIQDGELAWAIPRARGIAARIKDLLRDRSKLSLQSICA
ncbi:hypothetical protein J3R30DRAFT_3405750 [Lentinula aciculospora]|uniref:Fungal STAND N-terminal Goodbye domain-containing protein n=1 Tax=Lentinula aciculospora TaxID=153920 RepID=A0A9W9A768_9AGAR|nr:hypothetical protein J3R30DRAFT_3405750 [Lentinula aciculospora]